MLTKKDQNPQSHPTANPQSMPTATGQMSTAEEEEMIKRAMEISLQIENQKKQELDEEEEMIKRAMELSEREEQER